MQNQTDLDSLEPARGAPTRGFPIVGIGASAGGIDAFHRLLENVPPDTGMAFIMVLHLPPDRKSLLPEILARWTTMAVKDGVDGMRIEPDCVYVPPPHALVGIDDGCLRIRPIDPDVRVHRPIDGFFDALAAALGERAIGVVLSGTGSDGSLGLKAIKEAGGLTVAQGSEGSAPQYGDMPAGAIATGAVDLILPIEAIPAHLLRLRGRRGAAAPDAAPEPASDELRLEICTIIREQIGHDFSGYRDKTFLRRVDRRMQIVGASSLSEYVAVLRGSRDEVVQLFRDLLIRVTSFFRDEETFEVLESKVLPRLFEGKGADGHVRVWVPGCATGEEAYSLAILLRERMAVMDNPPKVQLFATDIDAAAIATARMGRYPQTLLDGISAERSARFFTLSQDTYVINKEVRDLCVFSPHSVVRDPPFSRMNLVSCRNLLIYMDKDLQDSVIPIFHYALVPGGVLLLGGSESLAKHAALFETLDKAGRIFVRRSVRGPPLSLPMSMHSPYFSVAQSLARAAPPTGGTRSTISSAQAMRSRAAGEPPQPRQTANREAASSKRAENDRRTLANVKRFFAGLWPGASAELVLRQELSSTEERLQSLEEEHQTALEELRSANEELHSVNEEMQSTNEELETSKEELQSLNEELHTVNLRLSEKLDELDATNSDLRNLFESTEIATIFLDRHLIVRSFTPAIATLYNLIPSDQGRPITDIVSRLNYDRLAEDVSNVLASLQPLERRMARTDRAAHYIMRILPYREPDSTVSGVLVTFVDVTSIVEAEQALVEADMRKDVFLATLSHELRNPLAPIRSAARLLQSSSLDPTQARAQAIIARQVAHMSSLLDDLLDVSRITRGSLILKRESVPIHSLMQAAVETVQPALESRDHSLAVEWPQAGIVLDVDPLRITQVLGNLLTNAAKYTVSGGLITLGCRHEAREIVLYVRDNGVGIPPEMLSEIFTMFTRIESDPGRAEGGLGIGLALAKGLIELHGGRLTAHSGGPGTGSEFTVSLPDSLIVADSAPSAQNVPREILPAKRILVADDSVDGAESLGLYFQMQGHEVHLAHGGHDALALAAAVKPEIGVIDIGMPDLNGYEVAQKIRNEGWGERMTLIALTGWGQESDKRRAIAAGFDHHCTKPIDPPDLERLFTKTRPES